MRVGVAGKERFNQKRENLLVYPGQLKLEIHSASEILK